MTGATDWPAAQQLTTERLTLEPLRVDHADEMAALLDDARLHAHIGGRPATAEELRARYERQTAGRSPDGAAHWRNWIVRRRDDGQAVGTVQATITTDDAGGAIAEVAWVVAVAYQRRGYAREAAAALAAWLRGCGARALIAHVHPANHASAAVARAIGLRPTDTIVDGEIRWTG